jgi:isoleucyl-tRNA synthetase
MGLYNPVPKTIDFPEMERRVLDFWKMNRTFAKLRAKTAGAPRWSFIDGPITANNPMGVHHAWGRALKDIFQRFYAMNGRDERFQNGFDCQGLWVEVEVEKSLGLAVKSDIYQYGIDRFVRDCKERVLTFAARQTEQSIRLGQWADWDDSSTLIALRDALHDGDREIGITTTSGKQVRDRASRLIARLGSAEFGGSYFTFSDENNFGIWAFLKKCHDQGFIYRGHDVIPWCSRCGTGLSQMEVAEGRRIVTHTSVFVRFPLRDQPKTALLVWTTTPWTLPANVAVAVNPEASYVRVRQGEWTYYVGKQNFENERVQELEAEGKKETRKTRSLRHVLQSSGPVEVLDTVAGRELIGLTYHGPFDELPAQKQPGGVFPFGKTGDGKPAVDSHKVIPWGEVSGVEGTGLVHIAPGCGAEDQQLGLEYNLPSLAPLDEAGNFIDGFGWLTGQNASEVADLVVDDLRCKQLLVAKERYLHVYPHCWRCKTELVFRPVDEWFINMSWRDRIQRIVPQIRWIPAEGEAREQDWLRNMGDWMISKKRFWGLALPIWVCDNCDHFMVIGSKQELQQKAVEGWETFKGHTPHRPYVDAVKIRCEKCGALAHRIEDVGTPWLDAGIVSFTTLQYFTDRSYWGKWFPADFVVESFPGQFRNWFYSLLAMSAMLEDKPPFRVLLGYGTVRDERGEEMHKSKGNAIAFDEAAEVLGAEVMRYMFAEQRPWIHLNFPDLHHTADTKSALDLEVKRRLLTLWNCYSFFVTYADVDGWRPQQKPLDIASRNQIDRWILSRLQRLIESAHQAFAEFELYRFMERIQDFLEDLSNWYLRRSRRRFWKSVSDQDKDAAYQTLYEVLTCMVRLLAPVLPFVSEEMYQNLVRSVEDSAAQSVHLTDYPVMNNALIDEELEQAIDVVIRVKNAAHHLRAQAKVKIRHPLPAIFVRPLDEHERKVLAHSQFASQVLEECNAKELRLIEDERALVKVVLKVNAKTVAPRYGKHFRAITSYLASQEAASVLASLKQTGKYEFVLDTETISLDSQDLVISYLGGEHIYATEVQGTFVALDTTPDPALEREGLVRDLNRHLQDYRKKIGLEVTDRITVQYSAPREIQEAVNEHRTYLQTELLADDIQYVESVPDGISLSLGGAAVRVSISRNGAHSSV